MRPSAPELVARRRRRRDRQAGRAEEDDATVVRNRAQRVLMLGTGFAGVAPPARPRRAGGRRRRGRTGLRRAVDDARTAPLLDPPLRRPAGFATSSRSSGASWISRLWVTPGSAAGGSSRWPSAWPLSWRGARTRLWTVKLSTDPARCRAGPRRHVDHRDAVETNDHAGRQPAPARGSQGRRTASHGPRRRGGRGPKGARQVADGLEQITSRFAAAAARVTPASAALALLAEASSTAG